jgi:3-deoxy-D-manno-octulosonic-acid transferase
MVFFYNLFIKIYTLLLRLLFPFNPKAKLWIKGREGLLDKIEREIESSKKKIWFHFASLGEFEQGRTVLERIKFKYPEKIIVITFFSPSGYEIRKNYPIADYIFYLPVDSSENAKRLIYLINPEFAVFTKYDYWYHYFNELNKQKVPLFVISAIFRKKYSVFKWYGGIERKVLHFITTIFVQDEESKTLLDRIGISNVVVSGDTRFDRVAENADHPKKIPEVEKFGSISSVASNNFRIFIAGSTWPQDEKLIAELAVGYPDWKFIIVPHEVSELRINSLITLFPKALKYSAMSNQTTASGLRPSDSQLLIIDNMGMLSSLYQYGDVAYIGGGFGAGIHNTLEAAAFNLPVIFGPNYYKFREAAELINEGAGFTIKNADELKDVMDRLQNTTFRVQAGELAGKYVRDHTGATEVIISHICK